MLTRMTIFTKVKHKKANRQTNILKYGVAVQRIFKNIISEHISYCIHQAI